MNASLEQVCDEMYDAANGTTLDHPDQFRIALRGFADRISEENRRDNAQKVYVVFHVHGGPEACDYEDTICGVFSELGDAKACLGNEYRAARPAHKWVFSEDRPEDNDFMSAEIVQTDGDSDRFEVTEREVW